MGTRTVLAVRVIAADDEYRFSEAHLSDKVFGTSGDPINLKSQYEACSYGQLRLDAVSDRQMILDPNDGQTTNIVDGVMTVKVDVKVSQGDISLRNAITAKINQVYNVTSPKKIAQHVMYCLPPSDGFVAYAFVNSWNSVFNNEFCNYVSVQMHEIGHNLRFAHSGQDDNIYGDVTGGMGGTEDLVNKPISCFNAAKSW